MSSCFIFSLNTIATSIGLTSPKTLSLNKTKVIFLVGLSFTGLLVYSHIKPGHGEVGMNEAHMVFSWICLVTVIILVLAMRDSNTLYFKLAMVGLLNLGLWFIVIGAVLDLGTPGAKLDMSMNAFAYGVFQVGSTGILCQFLQ